MKKLLFVFGFTLLALFSNAQDTKKLKIYTFEINEEIAPPIWRTTQKAFDQAKTEKADLIFIEMDTYGGQVDMADSIRTKILQSTIPVYVLINNNAASAGALISLACDSIYMRPGSTIGAATVVNQNGEAVPDKYQSYMRKKMRATAEENGRNPEIAEAMVDPDKVVPGISDSGKVVTFTTKEALLYGFCDAEVGSIEEALKHANITEYEVVTHKTTWVDGLIGFFMSPAISGILIMIMLGGIYFELQTPGIGFPIAAAISAAILYFLPLYMEGLAENWEILLFFIGLILLALEVFVIPGFGVAGISGILAIITSLALSMIENSTLNMPDGFNATPLLQPLLIVIISGSLSIILVVVTADRLLRSPMLSKVVLQQEEKMSDGYVGADTTMHQLVGKVGVAATILRPGGKVEIDENVYDAIALIGFIEKDTAIKVVDFQTTSLVVIKEKA